MAAIALRLEDRPDVFVERHRLGWIDALIFLRRLREGRHSRQNERGSEETILHGKGGLGPQKTGAKAQSLRQERAKAGSSMRGGGGALRSVTKQRNAMCVGLWGNERLNNELGFIRL
jgi:hypothetical protein